jgi:hypothetical protein
MTRQVNINMRLQGRLSVGLATATFAVLFFAGSVLLMESWFAALMAQTGLTLESFVAIFAVSAIILSAGAFVISWKQRPFLVTGLLAVSGIIFMIHPLSNFMSHLTHPQMIMGHSGAIPLGPILVVILGSAILGLSLAKGIRTSSAKQQEGMVNK